MRIGIDYSIAVRQGAGITRYTRELVQAAVRADPQSEFVLLWPGLATDHQEAMLAIPQCPNVDSIRLPFTHRGLTILWHRLRAPLWADAVAGGVDVFHSPDFALAPLRRAPGIVTVHDLSFLHFPEFTDAGLLSYLKRVVPRAVRQAKLVLADSESTRRDIIEWLHVDPERVDVIYAGIHPSFRPVTDPTQLAAVRDRYRLPSRYILAVGTVQPRKNLIRLMDAYSRLHQSLEIQLLIAGGLGWLYDSILAHVHELHLENVVRFLGYVADPDLPALYSLAECFAFPSLYEGFGLPPLEAMACGTPVVSSSVSSLPEVLGDAALLVDPMDVDALADALGRVLDDAGLRQKLVTKGTARARQFTWSAAALELLKAYRRASET